MTFIQKYAYDIGVGFASLLWPFFKKRRAIAVRNILKCGITSDEAENVSCKSALRIVPCSLRFGEKHSFKSVFFYELQNRKVFFFGCCFFEC